MDVQKYRKLGARSGSVSAVTALGGVGLPLLTVMGWGGSFPVAKAAMPAVNPVYLSAERYVVASVVFAAILWAT